MHFIYLLIVTFLLAMVSVPIVEIALGTKTYMRPYLRPDGRVLRLWLTLFVVWLVTFLVTAGVQLGADWLVTRAMIVDFDVTYVVISNPWYAPSFWGIHLLIMVAMLARLSFFPPAVAVVEGSKLFQRPCSLCRGRLLWVLLIGLEVETSLVIAFALVPFPFYGTLGFGAESVFQDGVLVTAPEFSPLATLVKHALDGALGLLETGTFTAAAVAACRQLRPELEFE